MKKYLSIWIRSYHIIRKDFNKFETDPTTQYNYHRKLIIFWMLNFLPMNSLVAIDIYAILTGNIKLTAIMTAILLAINTNYSLYANWDTEVGDAHGSYASMRADEIKKRQPLDSSSSENQTPFF